MINTNDFEYADGQVKGVDITSQKKTIEN